jgi:hypothetical protein
MPRLRCSIGLSILTTHLDVSAVKKGLAAYRDAVQASTSAAICPWLSAIAYRRGAEASPQPAGRKNHLTSQPGRFV